MNEKPTNRSQMDKLVRLSDIKALFHRGDERTFPFSFPGLVTERDVDFVPAVDAVEVVRCRECKHYKPSRYNGSTAHYCGVIDGFPKEDWFCKDGKRREEGDGDEP